VIRDLQSAGEGSGSSFNQRNLFELALDRLAAEFAAVNRTAKEVAVEQLTQALLEAKGGDQAEHRPLGASA
jgi:CarD family transcriptional regulator